MSDDTQTRQPPAPLVRMTLQGATPDVGSFDALCRAIDQAFDYRGDVTVETEDGRTLTGYLFDRRQAETAADSVLRMMLPDGSREVVCYEHVSRLEFTGRDTAEGRSWDTWVKKYVEKKRAGQTASIEPEEVG